MVCSYRTLLYVVVDVEHLQLALGLALVLVDVRHDLAQPGQRGLQRRVVWVVLVRVLQYICSKIRLLSTLQRQIFNFPFLFTMERDSELAEDSFTISLWRNVVAAAIEMKKAL